MGIGNPFNGSNAWSNCNFSAPHALAYDECWNAVYVVDRDHSRVVMLNAVTGEQYADHWGLEELLGPYFANMTEPSMMRVWSVRAVQTMSKDHTGELFVGIGSFASPAQPAYIAVLGLEHRDGPCDSDTISRNSAKPSSNGRRSRANRDSDGGRSMPVRPIRNHTYQLSPVQNSGIYSGVSLYLYLLVG